jgi:hypothetical protein
MNVKGYMYLQMKKPVGILPIWRNIVENGVKHHNPTLWPNSVSMVLLK